MDQPKRDTSTPAFASSVCISGEEVKPYPESFRASKRCPICSHLINRSILQRILPMTKPDLPLYGACRCGAVRFEILSVPLMTVACHCLDCQRMSASAFSLTAMLPSDDFKIIKGRPVEGSLPASLRHHFFCPGCMAWLFTQLEGVESRINVRPTLCDDTSWVKPFIETMTNEKLPWASTPAVHSFDGFPSMEEFKRLQAELAIGQQ